MHHEILKVAREIHDDLVLRLCTVQNCASASLKGLSRVNLGDDLALHLPDEIPVYVASPPPSLTPQLAESAVRWVCHSAIEDCFEILQDALCSAIVLCRARARLGQVEVVIDAGTPKERIEHLAARLLSPGEFKKIGDMRFDDLVRELETGHSLALLWKVEIDSLRRLRNCLTHRLGRVAEKDCGKSGVALELSLRRVVVRLSREDGSPVALSELPRSEPTNIGIGQELVTVDSRLEVMSMLSQV